MDIEAGLSDREQVVEHAVSIEAKVHVEWLFFLEGFSHQNFAARVQTRRDVLLSLFVSLSGETTDESIIKSHPPKRLQRLLETPTTPSTIEDLEEKLANAEVRRNQVIRSRTRFNTRIASNSWNDSPLFQILEERINNARQVSGDAKTGSDGDGSGDETKDGEDVGDDAGNDAGEKVGDSVDHPEESPPEENEAENDGHKAD